MQLKCSTPEAYKLLHDGVIALSEIEANGIRIDTELLEQAIKKVNRKIINLKGKLEKSKVWSIWKEEFGSKTKLGSGPQLAHVLFNKLGIKPVLFTAKGNKDDLGFGRRQDGMYNKPSTSEEALQDIDHPFVRRLFRMKGYEKTGGTFLKGIKREMIDGYLHPFFHLHTVRSWRGSSSQLNFQNIPKRDEMMAEAIRRCFISRKGMHFWEADFKGAEIGTSCCYHKDKAMIDYVKDVKKDMHKDTGADIFMLTSKQIDKRLKHLSKNKFVFAEFYGSYYKQTAKDLWEAICRQKDLYIDGSKLHVKDHLASKGIKLGGDFDPDQETESGTFESHIKEVERIFWYERFPGYTQWKKEWYNKFLKEGGFELLTGFYAFGPMVKNAVLNYPIQGTSFHLLLWFLIHLQRWLKKHKMKTVLCGQIHDSCEGNSPPDEIQDVLEKATELVSVELPKAFPWIIVPLRIEIAVSQIGASWFEMCEWTNQNGKWQLVAV